MSRSRKAMVIRKLFRYKRLSPRQTAEFLGVSNGTAFNIIKDLLKSNLILQVGTENTNAGRRPTLYSVNPSAAYAITIDMSDYNMKIKVVDLSMTLVHAEEFFYDISRDRGVNFELLAKQLKNVNKRFSNKAIGIGIGLSGIVDVKQGVIENNRLTEFNNLNQFYFLGKYLSLPVYMGNDANLSALAEEWETAKEESNIFYIFLGEGIGAGIVQKGMLYKGSHGYAGEVCDSYLLKDGKEHVKINDLLSTLVIESNVSEKMGKKIKFSEIAKIYQEENTGVVEDVINSKTEYLSLLLANIITTLDPQTIIIGGDYVKLGEKFLHNVEKNIKDFLSYPFNVSFRIKYRKYPENISLGAAYLTFQNWLDSFESKD